MTTYELSTQSPEADWPSLEMYEALIETFPHMAGSDDHVCVSTMAGSGKIRITTSSPASKFFRERFGNTIEINGEVYALVIVNTLARTGFPYPRIIPRS